MTLKIVKRMTLKIMIVGHGGGRSYALYTHLLTILSYILLAIVFVILLFYSPFFLGS